MIFKNRSFKKEYLKLDGIDERECLQSLTKGELKLLMQEFLSNKQFYLHSYLKCVEGDCEIEELGLNDQVLAILQNHCWKEYLYFNEMVNWCEMELEKRKL